MKVDIHEEVDSASVGSEASGVSPGAAWMELQPCRDIFNCISFK